MLVQSLQDKETTCPEHGRWSDEAADFLWQLALSKRLAESLVEQGERDTVSDKGAPVARSERADTCDAQRVTSSISSSSSRGTTPKIRSHVGRDTSVEVREGRALAVGAAFSMSSSVSGSPFNANVSNDKSS